MSRPEEAAPDRDSPETQGVVNAFFTIDGRRAVERVAECFQQRPLAWLLLAVQTANVWAADELVVRSEASTLQLEFRGIGDKRDWLRTFLPVLVRGELTGRRDNDTALRLLWSALANATGSVILAASGVSEDASVSALEVGLEVSRPRQAELPPGRFLLQCEFKQPEPALFREFVLFSCSDRTRVSCHREVPSFVPSATQREAVSRGSAEKETVLGLFAMPGEGKSAIPLGRSFDTLDVTGMRRHELTFGVFRTALLGPKNAGSFLAARSVIVFSVQPSETLSRLVWLKDGVVIAASRLTLNARRLTVTVYRELPDDLDWDLGGLQFSYRLEEFEPRLREAADDIRAGLALLVKEYNEYSPGIDGQTVGCWSVLALSTLAGGGLLAPFLGSYLAGGASLLTALGLMRAEFRHRHRERYAIGEELIALVGQLDNVERGSLIEDRLFWPGETLFNSEDFP